MRKIKFKPMPERMFLGNYGFVNQWCCKCGNRHIWHFKIHRRGKDGDQDFIEICGFQDDKGTELRKFYENKFNQKQDEEKTS